MNSDKLIKLFNLERGEEKIVLLLIAYSFFMGAAIAFFVSSATSLFLVQFERGMLPITFIISGIIVYLLGLVFSRLQKKINFSKLVNLAISFLFVSSSIFLVYYLFDKAAWLVFVLYSWIRVFAYIHAVVFWGVATKLFSLRQGKRIFGIIGTGEVISSIISFFSIPILLSFIQTEDLLIIAIIALIFSFLLMFIIVGANKEKLATKKIVQDIDDKKDKHKISFFENKYFTYIFFISLFPVLAQFLVEFIFQAQIKIQFPVKDALTGFLALFFGFTSIVEFVLKTFLAGRLISKYGIKLGLIVFPLMLFISFLLASVSGVLYGTLSMFFSFVTLGRLFSRAARTAFHDPAAQILFQPIPNDVRLDFQSKIEGGPKAFGNIVAGVLILLLSLLSFLNLVHFSIILFVIVVIWLKISLDTYKEYKKSIENVLNTKTENKNIEIQLDDTSHELSDSIKKYNNNFDKLTNFSFIYEPIKTYKILSHTYTESRNEIKDKIINIYTKNNNVKELKITLEFEQKNNNSIYIDKINETIENISKINFSKIEEKSKSQDVAERVEAALLLGNSKRYNAPQILLELLQDSNIEVRKQAFKTSYYFNNQTIYQKLIGELQNFSLKNICITSIIAIGEPIITELIKSYNKNYQNIELQVIILQIIGEIESKRSTYFLRTKIESQNSLIRNTAINALINLNYVANRSETTLINMALEEEIEIIVWFIATIQDLNSKENNALINSLSKELELKKENIFNLISIIYTKETIDIIKKNLISPEGNNKGYALEILDMILNESTKDMLLPLFESTANKQIIEAYKDIFPQQKLAPKERIKDVINKNINHVSAYTKSIAIFELSKFATEDVTMMLIAYLPNQNQIIKESVAYNLYKIDDEKFFDYLIKLNVEDRIIFSDFNIRFNKLNTSNNLFIFEKINKLKMITFFEDIFEKDLIKIAENTNNYIINIEQEIIINTQKYLYFVIEGSIILYDNEQEFKISPLQLIDKTLEQNQTTLKCKAENKAHILEIDFNLLLNLVAENKYFKQNYIKYLNQ